MALTEHNTLSMAEASRGITADAVNAVAYRGARIILTRYDKPVAALVPLSDMARLEAGAVHKEHRMRTIRIVPTTAAEPLTETYRKIGADRFLCSLENGCINISVPDPKAFAVPAGYAIAGLAGSSENRPNPNDPDWPAIAEAMGGGLVRFYEFDQRRWVHFDPSAPTSWRDTASMAAV